MQQSELLISILAFQELYVKINYVIQFNWKKKTKKPSKRATKGHNQQANKIFLGEANTDYKTKSWATTPKRPKELLSQWTQTAASILIRSYQEIWLTLVPTWWQQSRQARHGRQEFKKSYFILLTASLPKLPIGNQKYDTHSSNCFFSQ